MANYRALFEPQIQAPDGLAGERYPRNRGRFVEDLFFFDNDMFDDPEVGQVTLTETRWITPPIQYLRRGGRERRNRQGEVYGAPPPADLRRWDDITRDTPTLSHIAFRYENGQPSYETPLSMTLRAYPLAIQETKQRWFRANIPIQFSRNRDVMIIIRYGTNNPNEYTLRVGRIRSATFIDDFVASINERLDSFDLEEFQNSPIIIIEVELLFQQAQHWIYPQQAVAPVIPVAPVANVQNYNPANILELLDEDMEELNLMANMHGIVFRGYKDIKRKMFHNRELHTFYHMTDAVMEVPETEEGMCFTMAFMKCQLRILYSIDDTIIETKSAFAVWKFEENGSTDWMDANEHFDPYDCTRINASHIENRDFYDNYNGGHIVLFNPYKAKELSHEDGFEELYRSVTNEYCHDWLLAAQDIHDQVEKWCGFHVNYQNRDEVTMLYSQFFKVHIHLYTLNGSGSRFLTFVHPDVRKYQRHVHILVSDIHCSPITNVRTFMQKVSGSGKMSLHNFCDICTYTTCSSVNASKMRDHIKKCVQENTECINRELTIFDQKSSSTLHQRCLFYRQKEEYCRTCGQLANKICNTNHDVTTFFTTKCALCKEEIADMCEGFHKCYVNTPSIPKPLRNEQLWVYDIEAQQNQMGDQLMTDGRTIPLNMYHHEVILVCMMQVYTREKLEYTSLDSFCEDLCNNPIYDDAVILAHNGGGYDHQYVLQYCEKSAIEHIITPHAASAHKFLCLEINPFDRKSRRLIDFMAFVPGGLKQIGKDFGLQVTKGDFPHNFSRRMNLHYKGSIPPLHSEEDYYGYIRKRTKKDQDELQQWYDTEALKFCACNREIGENANCLECTKPYWDFHVELKKYCWLDVEVLAQAAQLYREDAMQDAAPEEETFNWNYKGVDPFTMLTQSQVGINTFLLGIKNPIRVASTQFSLRESYNEKSNVWLREKSERLNIEIIYKGNSLKEWYCARTDEFYPGFCIETKTVFLFYDCQYESCSLCTNGGLHANRNMTQEQIKAKRKFNLHQLQRFYKVEYIWEHDFDNMNRGATYNGRIMEDRSFFYGGRTEVFKSFSKSDEDEELKYTDVCSLYPYVCAKKSLPLDFPHIYYGNKIEPERAHFQHYNRYFGFMYCRVIPSPGDILGLLPGKSPEGRLQFTIEEQWGCWHTEELYLAQEAGYVIAEVVQVFHWDEDMRSDTYVRGYISYWLRQKQEAEGWMKCGGSSEDPPYEEKLALIEALYIKNGCIGKMRIDKVRKSPVKRLIAKLKLNSWWGKWVQIKQDESKVHINGYQQYLKVLTHPGINLEKMRFRHIKDNMFSITYHRLKGYEMSNNKYNIFIGASVTAHARCILHREMIRIGPERIIYCDTDSVIAKKRREMQGTIGGGLGDWVDEHPNEEISTFYGFAPKSYNLELQDGTNELKTKGISLTMQNKMRVTKEVMDKLLETVFFNGAEVQPPLLLENMNITTNSRYTQLPYASLLTLYNSKIMRPVLTKRKLIRYFGAIEDKSLSRDFEHIVLVPIGYCRDEMHERELSLLYYGP